VPLKTIKANDTIVHLHIGKTGGTSLDVLLKHNLPSNVRYVGHSHFDWSYINEITDNPRVIVMLRNPVHRFVSHFNFAKKLPWTQGLKIRDLSLEEYLNDEQAMEETSSIWMDGQGAGLWLTGTHTEYTWVKTSMSKHLNQNDDILTTSIPPIMQKEIDERKQSAKNHKYMCNLARKRLNTTIWFGILEELDISMEMLGTFVGKNLELPKRNINAHTQVEDNSEIYNKIKALIPIDIWIYSYACKLQSARYDAYKQSKTLIGGIYMEECNV